MESRTVVIRREKLGRDRGAGFEGDGCAEPGELLLEVLVAPQYMPGAVHYRGALGHQARHHQGRPAPQVRRLHDRPREAPRPPDERPVPAEEVYTRVHPVQLLGDLEPVLVDVLGDDPRPRGLGEEDHHLGLQVGGEAGERQCGDVHAREVDGIVDPHPDAAVRPLEGVHVHAHLPELLELHLQVLGTGASDGHVPAGCGGRHDKGAGLDAVGHHRPLYGLELLYALDHDPARARAPDACAHRVKEVGQGHDLRLAGAVLDDRDPVGQDGGHHHVLGGSYARVLEVDLRPPQAARRGGLYETVVELHLRAQGAQPVEVEVELPQAQITPAWSGDLGLAEAGGERPEYHDARAHLAHQIVRGRVGVDVGGVYLQRAPGEEGLDPEPLEDGEHGLYVLYARNVVQNGLARRQQRRGGELQGRVLGPGDLDLPAETCPSLDEKSFHTAPPWCAVFLPALPGVYQPLCPARVTKRLHPNNDSVTAGSSLALCVLPRHVHEGLSHPLSAFDLRPLPLGVFRLVRELGELALCLLYTVLGLGDVYLLGRDGLLDQDLDQVLGDLEEAVGGREDAQFVILADADLTKLDRRDDRRVVHQDPDLAVRDPGDDQVRLVVEDHTLRRDDPAEELSALTFASLGHASLPGPTRRPDRSRKASRPDPACPRARRPRTSRPRRTHLRTRLRILPHPLRPLPHRLCSWPSRWPRLCCRRGRTPVRGGRRA